MREDGTRKAKRTPGKMGRLSNDKVYSLFVFRLDLRIINQKTQNTDVHKTQTKHKTQF